VKQFTHRLTRGKGLYEFTVAAPAERSIALAGRIVELVERGDSSHGTALPRIALLSVLLNLELPE
jgi:hypothetical protein